MRACRFGVMVVLLSGAAFAQGPDGGAPSLRLVDALALGLEHHPLIRQAAATVDVLEGRQTQALGSYLPQVNLFAQYQRAHGAFARVGTGTAGVPNATGATTNLFSVGLSGSQVVWDFGLIERYRAAGLLTDAQRATARATSLQVALSVRRAYFQAAAQRALIRVNEEAKANAELHLRQIEGLAQAAQRTGIDVAQAQTQVANAELGLINTKNAELVALATLNQAIGAQQSTHWSLEEVSLQPLEGEDAALEELVKQAFEARPELESLRRQEQAWLAQRNVALSGFMPSLGVSGSVSESGQAIENLGLNWSFGVGLNWNLINGGQSTGLYREMAAQARAVEAALDAQLLQVRVDVETARSTIVTQRSALEAAAVAVRAAKSQLQLAEGRLGAGIGTTLELADAQILFTNARSQEVQAQLSLSSARASLLAALGRP